jgi:hypothetical protein
MADAFKYLSPREFHKLSAARKERYLAALFEILHPDHKSAERGAEGAPKPDQVRTQDGKD